MIHLANQPAVKPEIRDFLQQRIGSGVQFSDEDDIFKLGLVNSLFALELVVFLEKNFSIRVENEDLDLNNFSTLNNLEKFIQKKQANP